MDEEDALCLTCCEEANDVQVDQADFVQIERDARPSGLYLPFQFFDMLPCMRPISRSVVVFPFESFSILKVMFTFLLSGNA
jgi:hypothetical protein